MDLSHVRSLLINETRQKMAGLATHAPIASKAQALRDLSRLFEGVGICQLLVDADVPKFRENLVRSAQARRYFLQRARVEQDGRCRFLGLSRSEALFHALAAGATELARELVSLSITEWHANWEYEDDFCYLLFVHGLAWHTDFAASPPARALTERFERVLDGQRTPRLALCKAMLARDALALREALEAFLAERKTRLDSRREEITEYSAQALFWPQSFVSTEALAWLQLAHAQGLALQDDEFLFCPRAVRQFTQPVPAVDDFFVSLDKALGP